jgi:hypothetical protein
MARNWYIQENASQTENGEPMQANYVYKARSCALAAAVHVYEYISGWFYLGCFIRACSKQ